MFNLRNFDMDLFLALTKAKHSELSSEWRNMAWSQVTYSTVFMSSHLVRQRRYAADPLRKRMLSYGVQEESLFYHCPHPLDILP